MDSVISVIIPSYNHEKYIGYAIQSVINQTYQNIELIIVDDCSSDKTPEIIQSYKEKYEERFNHFIYVQKDENKGVIDSLNTAIDLASGEYIFLMASDDAAKPNGIEILYNFAKDNPEYGFIGGNSELMDENNQRCYWTEQMKLTQDKNDAKYLTWSDYSRFVAKNCSKIDYDSLDFGNYASLLRCNYIVNGYMYKKSAIIQAGKYKHNVFEDWYMELEVAKKYKFKYIDEIVYEYRKHFTNSIDNVSYSKPRYYTTIASQKKYCYDNNMKDLWDEVYGVNCGEIETTFINNRLMGVLDDKNDKDFQLFCSVIQEKNDEIKRLKSKKSAQFATKNEGLLIKRVLEYIFSIKNSEDKKNKIITFMGIKIYIKRETK